MKYIVEKKLNYHVEGEEKRNHIDLVISKIHEKMKENGVAESKNGEHNDLIFSVGGDGTMLHSIGKHIQAYYNDPKINVKAPLFIGINAGNVGFLTPYETSHVLDGTVFNDLFRNSEPRSEERALIKYETQDGKVFTVVNELAINPTAINDLVEFSMEVEHFGNGIFKKSGKYSANTLLLSTPMGSTAYNKNAGGAIIDPNTRSIQFTLVAPMLLGNRPIVFGEKTKIKIVAEKTIDIWADGQNTTRLEKGESIIVSLEDISANILLPEDWNYFSFLTKKLHWNNGKEL